MCLRLGTKVVDPVLVSYVFDFTTGRPRYVLEALEQLKNEKHLSDDCKLVTSVDKIPVADWTHTAMVGDVLCEIESLDPQESAVIKMATVFQAGFTVSDLASCSKSSWSGAVYLDNLRLYKACHTLMTREMLERDMSGGSGDNDTPTFILKNALVRCVASTMLLEAQKNAVKRSALMQRRLEKDLPTRLQEKRRRDKELHLPYWILTDLG